MGRATAEGHPVRLSKRDQLAIGHEVQVARDIYNTPWKKLSRVYGLGRTRLYQLYRMAKDPDIGSSYRCEAKSR